ncbi:MAG: UTP--glucose-1-phosphate uridylyltransferase GalU [Vicinamibacteria bacterium]|nr:UTP--glucose-1-phosphate uridylyltransferase GalU [Vicinamibacteria bacterium]
MRPKVRKVVIPAAGLGTRFLPATKSMPKEMLCVVDKPIIQYAVEEARASGIEHVIIVTGRSKSSMEDHFDVSYELEATLRERGKLDLVREARKVSDLASVSYVRQKEPLGLGHAVLAARDLVGNEPFAVMLPDDLIDAAGVPALRQMIDVFESTGDPVIALLKVAMEEISAYGVIRGDRDAKDARVHVLKELVEKPKREDAPSDLAIIGRYILTPDIFEDLVATTRDKSGEIQLTNGLRALVSRRRLLGYEFEGTRYDAGQKLGFLKATVDLALKRDDLGPALRAHIQSLGLR